MKKLIPLAILLLLIPVFLFTKSVFERKNVNFYLRIEKGENLKQIVKELSKLGLIDYPEPTYYYLKLVGTDLKAGCYRVKGKKNLLEIFQEFKKGTPCLKKFTIPPGSDVFTLNLLLSKKGICKKGEVLNLSRDEKFLKELKIPSLDGYLFPDTYFVNENADCKDSLKEAVREFREEVLPIFENYKPPERVRRALKTPTLNEIITVASIIEKESSCDEEKPLIAAVIYNRLSRGMKIQCDPTVIYSLKLKGIFKERLTYKDLKVKSPFNTYLVSGLPPHPICNPSLNSIRAALYPANVDYLYFVSNGHGRHVFSKSYNQHVKNVARYRRNG